MQIETSIELLSVNLNLSDHTNELESSQEIIDNLKTEINDIIKSDGINNLTHDFYFDEVVRILAYIGSLSVQVSNILLVLEDIYFNKYKHSPVLAKKLWLEHYDNLHQPYSLLKNRCFRLLDCLDDGYIKKFKSYPPNWEI